MSYQATVLPVMIASPGDVTEERDIVREILHEWNDIHAAHRGVVFLPIGWDTNSSPELGDRPQSQINSRILGACDLLIGIFWTKLGTPTGDSVSGTVEEIERHVSAGKPAMLYFSDRLVNPKEHDPIQYESLNKFRSSCMPKGLVESYTTTDEFRKKLRRQVQHCLHDNEYLKEISNQQQPNIVFAPEPVPKPTQWHDPYGDPVSPTAMMLLKAAATIHDGHILNIPTIGSQSIQAGGKKFGDAGARDFAKWESALQELVQHNLVQRKSPTTNVLTHDGWQLADKA